MSRATIIWRTAVSIDGRIAAAGDSLDFLETISPAAAAAEDFTSFLKTIDAIIVGAGTLRWLLRGGHGWPHGDLPTWLVSHDDRLVAQVAGTAAPFSRVEDLEAMLGAIDGAGHKRVWLSGGGEIAGQLLRLDRIDEIEATIAPVALGAGTSLFGDKSLELRPFQAVSARVLDATAVSVRWVRAR